MNLHTPPPHLHPSLARQLSLPFVVAAYEAATYCQKDDNANTDDRVRGSSIKGALCPTSCMQQLKAANFVPVVQATSSRQLPHLDNATYPTSPPSIAPVQAPIIVPPTSHRLHTRTVHTTDHALTLSEHPARIITLPPHPHIAGIHVPAYAYPNHPAARISPPQA